MHGAIKQHFSGAAAVVLVAGLLVTPAAAQQPTQAQQNAVRQSCRADYQANCAAVQPGGTAALACLQQHAAQLSAPCRDAVAAVGGPASNAPANNSVTPTTPPAASAAPSMSPRQQMAVLRGACGADYRRYCHGVRPGGGRALQCLQDHGESLSNGCRSALSQVAH